MLVRLPVWTEGICATGIASTGKCDCMFPGWIFRIQDALYLLLINFAQARYPREALGR